MDSKIPVSGWVRFGANILTIYIFILCYILVLKRRSESLLASKMRTHILLIFHLVATPVYAQLHHRVLHE